MTPDSSVLRIALLHIAPIPGNLAYNRHSIEAAVHKAADLSADWAILPELSVCGYTFAKGIGTEWILPQPDPWMKTFCHLASDLQITVFLSHPERDTQTGNLYNSVFVITSKGTIAGKHRKNNTLKNGSEAWSSPGNGGEPVPVSIFTRVGILICADAYFPGLAGKLKERGANLLVSAAAWAPGFHGPNGEWEQRTLETNLPLVVCNRTGLDGPLDFRGAESVVAAKGRCLISFTSDHSALFLIALDLASQSIIDSQSSTVKL